MLPDKRRRKENTIINLTKADFDELTGMADIAFFEGCFGKYEDEQREWFKALEEKVEDEPSAPKKRESNNRNDNDQLTRMDIQAIRRDLDYII